MTDAQTTSNIKIEYDQHSRVESNNYQAKTSYENEKKQRDLGHNRDIDKIYRPGAGIIIIIIIFYQNNFKPHLFHNASVYVHSSKKR